MHARCFTVPRPYTAQEFADFLASDLCFLVTRPHGFALGRAVAGEAELITLAVDPDSRRQGQGAMLLDAFEAAARTRCATRAFLEVAADNTAARALYRRAGYADTGRRLGYYRAAHGAVDAVLMAKPLTA